MRKAIATLAGAKAPDVKVDITIPQVLRARGCSSGGLVMPRDLPRALAGAQYAQLSTIASPNFRLKSGC